MKNEKQWLFFPKFNIKFEQFKDTVNSDYNNRASYTN